MIQVSRPSISDDELKAVAEVFKTAWLGMGDKVKQFEKELSDLLDGLNVIAVNTGSTALHLALDAIGIKEGDEVITPSLTFVAAIQAITALGARPIFCDVEPDTLNLNTQEIKKKISSRTKALMPMHYRGEPCEMDEIIDLAKNNGLRIVEDAAHAFGSKYKGKLVGSFGDLICFSFDPIKNITCGEGGAIVTADKQLAETLAQKRILGIDKDTWSRYHNQRSLSYDVVRQGYRYHMSNINAAIGIVQLKKLPKFIQRKNEIAKRYDCEFSAINDIEILKTDYSQTALFTYVIKVKNNRDALMEHLKQQGVGSGINYIPSHLFTYYQNFKMQLPVTEEAYRRIITLPLYYDMSEEDLEHVIKAVKSFFTK